MASGGKSILEMWLGDTPNSNHSSVKKERKDFNDLFNPPPPPTPSIPPSSQLSLLSSNTLSMPSIPNLSSSIPQTIPLDLNTGSSFQHQPIPNIAASNQLSSSSSSSFFPDTSTAFAHNSHTSSVKEKNSATRSTTLSNTEKPNDTDEEPIDSASIRGVFGWSKCKDVYLPYILRKKDKVIPVRIVESKIIGRYSGCLPWKVFSCINIRSYFLTENEAKLLNEINFLHCDSFYGTESFTCKDVVVCLTDVEILSRFLETSRGIFERGLENCNFLGFVQLSNSSTVIPYITKEVLEPSQVKSKGPNNPETTATPQLETSTQNKQEPNVLSEIFPEFFEQPSGTNEVASNNNGDDHIETNELTSQGDLFGAKSNGHDDQPMFLNEHDELDRLLDDEIHKELEKVVQAQSKATTTSNSNSNLNLNGSDSNLFADQYSNDQQLSSDINIPKSPLTKLLDHNFEKQNDCQPNTVRSSSKKYKELVSLLTDDDVIVCGRTKTQKRKYVPCSLLNSFYTGQAELMQMTEWDASYLKMICIYAGHDDLINQMGKVYVSNTAGGAAKPSDQLCLLDDLKVDTHLNKLEFQELRILHPPTQNSFVPTQPILDASCGSQANAYSLTRTPSNQQHSISSGYISMMPNSQYSVNNSNISSQSTLRTPLPPLPPLPPPQIAPSASPGYYSSGRLPYKQFNRSSSYPANASRPTSSTGLVQDSNHFGQTYASNSTNQHLTRTSVPVDARFSSSRININSPQLPQRMPSASTYANRNYSVRHNSSINNPGMTPNIPTVVSNPASYNMTSSGISRSNPALQNRQTISQPNGRQQSNSSYTQNNNNHSSQSSASQSNSNNNNFQTTSQTNNNGGYDAAFFNQLRAVFMPNGLAGLTSSDMLQNNFGSLSMQTLGNGLSTNSSTNNNNGRTCQQQNLSMNQANGMLNDFLNAASRLQRNGCSSNSNNLSLLNSLDSSLGTTMNTQQINNAASSTSVGASPNGHNSNSGGGNVSESQRIYRIEINGCTLRAISLHPYSNSLGVLVGEVVQKLLTGVTYLSLIPILEKVFKLQLYEFSKHQEMAYLRAGYKPITGDKLVSVDLLRKNLPHIKHYILTQTSYDYSFQANSNNNSVH